MGVEGIHVDSDVTAESVQAGHPVDILYFQSRGDRIRDQFNLFMEIMEKEYRTHHDVNYYAGRLSVTPKHLTTITRRVSGKSAKELIDEYIVMQLKLTLTSTTVSIKEIAWDYNFPSTAFLCSYFSSRTGITPLQYRRSEQGAG